MALYSKQELEQITIDNFLKDCAPDVREHYLADVSAVRDIFPDADGFRQGCCQLFALALQRRFGYDIYRVSDGSSCHYFCKSDDEKTYIDVRGCFANFADFTADLYIKEIVCDISVRHIFTAEDEEPEYNDTIYAFANYVIDLDPARYEVEPPGKN